MNFKKYHVSRNLIRCTNTTSTTGSGAVINQTAGKSEVIIVSRTATDADGSVTIEVLAELSAGTYTLSVEGIIDRGARNVDRIFIRDNGNNVIVNNVQADKPQQFTISEDVKITKLTLVFAAVAEYSNQVVRVMLNSGSTSLPFEPYSSEVWHDTPHYVHNTSTDTITTLPADIYPNDTTATVGLKGNMSQSSGVSPTTPIQPSECGDRTGNLFDYTSLTMQQGAYIDDNGDLVTTGATAGVAIIYWSWVPVSELTEYCMSCATSRPWTRVYFYDSNKNFLSRSSANNTDDTAKSFTTPSNCAYVNFQEWTGSNPSNELNTVMLNTGSIPLPYEPYGYKIPISSASTTTPVYLGEVETTRKIQKLVLTGGQGENWLSNTLPQSGIGFHINIQDMRKNERTKGYCTHFEAVSTPSGVTTDGITYGVSYGAAVTATFMYISFSTATATALSISDVTTFKVWLAAQYAAGTPVTVWYVLATPETAVVNEPLRKIGEYADEVSNVLIPVTAGGDTISVDTTLQPSGITATYKGWHPAIVHERTNGAWT